MEKVVNVTETKETKSHKTLLKILNRLFESDILA